MNLFCREPDGQRTSLYWELSNGCTVNIDRSRSKGGSDLWSLSLIGASGDDDRSISGYRFPDDFPLPADFPPLLLQFAHRGASLSTQQAHSRH